MELDRRNLVDIDFRNLISTGFAEVPYDKPVVFTRKTPELPIMAVNSEEKKKPRNNKRAIEIKTQIR